MCSNEYENSRTGEKTTKNYTTQNRIKMCIFFSHNFPLLLLRRRRRLLHNLLLLFSPLRSIKHSQTVEFLTIIINCQSFCKRGQMRTKRAARSAMKRNREYNERILSYYRLKKSRRTDGNVLFSTEAFIFLLHNDVWEN